MALMTLIGMFILAFVFPILYPIAQALFYVFCALIIYETWNVYRYKNGINAERKMADKLSNGDYNSLSIIIENTYPFTSHLEVIDEIPVQFQYRNSSWFKVLKPNQKSEIEYQLRPIKRGAYEFGSINVYVSTFIKMVQRRYKYDENRSVPVYPSILQMQKYEFAAISNYLKNYGIKKLRRIGHTMEFEQIKEYTRGDDPRTINWKASARSNTLMINNYQDEKSQPIYCIIDKGRLMRFPFEGLSLLDYAINATLIMSNIALKKQDKAGVITFSNTMSSVVPAEHKSGQLKKILEVLYNQKTLYKESNFELLSTYVNRKITQRSLLLCFTNFESVSSFRRQLPYFVSLAKRHLLVVIFFKNREMNALIESQSSDLEEIYTQTIAEQYESEKYLIVKQLKKYGIQSILTYPEDLSVNTINKYLELKARGSF